MADGAAGSATAYLLERALDQARADQLKELAADAGARPKKGIKRTAATHQMRQALSNQGGLVQAPPSGG